MYKVNRYYFALRIYCFLQNLIYPPRILFISQILLFPYLLSLQCTLVHRWSTNTHWSRGGQQMHPGTYILYKHLKQLNDIFYIYLYIICLNSYLKLHMLNKILQKTRTKVVHHETVSQGCN